jgi:hypothetical protein
MTITLPDDVLQKAELQAKAGGFASVGEYLADLVREDENYPDVPPSSRTVRTREELEALLNETLGKPVLRMDETFWQQIDDRIAAAERGKTA